MAAPNKQNTASLKENEKKWGKALMEAGWTAVPSIILEKQQALGLTPVDVNILLHLMTYWWHAGNEPFPSKRAIAEAMGYSSRHIQRKIEELERDGLIKREKRFDSAGGQLTNRYTFDGLIAAVLPYAKEKIQHREKNRAEDADRRRRKGRPKLAAVGGKKPDLD
jgi:hypothetical protein|tara:strand:+ start:9092 stop:9586 length:495 start_codon:yes stop_codon:yes gene_type:complete